jgi:hypothetical protein
MMVEEADFCFIATAVYGDLNHPRVVTLRRFRDQVLRKSTGGRFFIRWYYQNGLEIARVMQGKNLMVKCCRILLDCFVRLINSLTNHS